MHLLGKKITANIETAKKLVEAYELEIRRLPAEAQILLMCVDVLAVGLEELEIHFRDALRVVEGLGILTRGPLPQVEDLIRLIGNKIRAAEVVTSRGPRLALSFTHPSIAEAIHLSMTRSSFRAMFEPVLTRLASSGDWRVRKDVTAAILRHLERLSEEAQGLLLRSARDEDPDVRLAVAEGLVARARLVLPNVLAPLLTTLAEDDVDQIKATLVC